MRCIYIGGYLTWILEFSIWHLSWMANMVGHCIEIWRPCCHHLWLKLCLLLLNLWWKISSKEKTCNLMCFKVFFLFQFSTCFVFFFFFLVFRFLCSCKSMNYVCFGKDWISFDLRIGNFVFSVWCHGCSWDYVSLLLVAFKF
jgi:hypothetical protein